MVSLEDSPGGIIVVRVQLGNENDYVARNVVVTIVVRFSALDKSAARCFLFFVVYGISRTTAG